MSDLNFAQPDWFWGLLLLVPLIGLRIWSQIRGRDRLSGLVSPRLMKQLVSSRGQSQKWTVFTLQSLAVALAITALARPQLGYDEIESQTEARNLIIAIDTSRSMLANDIRPNRLERAKLAAMDIIRSLPSDRVGLIAFAGRPFLQAPLTVDHEAIIEAINQMDTEIIPRGGTNIAAAAQMALETFEEADLEQSALVLFSDGEALEGTDQIEKIREQARKAGMSIIAVGVGTQSGDIIPELNSRGEPIPGKYVMDEEGQVVRTRLDPTALQTLASGGGVYVHLGGQASLTRVAKQIQNEIATSREESEARRRPKERFMWPLSFAVGFLILAHLAPIFWIGNASQRRGLATLSSPATSLLALLAILPITFQETASANDDPLFLGHEAFQQGNYAKAIKTYEEALSKKTSSKDESLLQLALGAAAFRQGDYQRASEAYGQALVGSGDEFQAHAHYNLGNTLFRQGESALQSTQKPDPDQPAPSLPPGEIIEATIQQWESAVEHYESALALKQQNQKAAHNIEVVKKKIEDLKKQQEEQQKQEEQKQKEEEQEDKENQEDQENSEEDSGDSEEDEESESDPKDSSESQDGDNESENQENGSGDQDPENQEDGSNESQEENEEPENAEDENAGENEPEQGENDKPENPENGDQPGESDPGDGKLEANPNQQQPQQSLSNAAQREVNPETGYSPSEARQLLEALADETEVRPMLAPSRGEKFKNW